MKKILALVMCGWLCGFLAAGESVTDMRRQVQDSLAKVSSSMFTERIKGLRMFTAILDPQLLGEFQVIDRIKAVANDPKENPSVRVEAVNTLVVFRTNGIEVPKILELFNGLILVKSEKDRVDLRVCNAALNLLPSIAPMQAPGAPANPERDKIVNTLRELYNKRAKLPSSTYMSLVAALGNFGDKDGALKLLYDIASLEKSAPIRCAALRAIRNAITVQGKADKKLIEIFEGWLDKAKGPENMEARVLIVDCLEGMLAQVPLDTRKGYKVKPGTKALVLDMLAKGNDMEVISAVKYLMRVSAQDPAIVDNFLAAAVPDAQRNPPLTFKALEIINAGLVNVLNAIGNDKKNAAAAQKIIEHMLSMLNPTVKGVPEEIKETMIMGLGIIPPTFSRVSAVGCLIDLLGMEAQKEAPVPGRIRQLEDALMALTENAPFEIITYEQVTAEDGTVRILKKRAPDIAAWNDWLGKNKQSLEAK